MKLVIIVVEGEVAGEVGGAAVGDHPPVEVQQRTGAGGVAPSEGAQQAYGPLEVARCACACGAVCVCLAQLRAVVPL